MSSSKSKQIPPKQIPPTKEDYKAYITVHGKRVFLNKKLTEKSGFLRSFRSYEGEIPIKIKSRILKMALDYCEYDGNKSRIYIWDMGLGYRADDAFNLLHAASWLDIRSLYNQLFDPAFDIIDDSTPEEIEKMFKVRYNGDDDRLSWMKYVLDCAPKEDVKFDGEEIFKVSPADFKKLSDRQKKRNWVFAHLVIKRNPAVFIVTKQLSKEEEDSEEEQEPKQEAAEEESKVPKNDYDVGGSGPTFLSTIMAAHQVELSLDNVDNDFHTRFSELIDFIRLLPRSPTHHGPLNPYQILDIQFTDQAIQQPHIVCAKMRLDNYSLIGFQRHGEQLFEIRDDAEGHKVLENSNWLRDNVRYPSDLVNTPLGIGNFVGAVRGLRNDQHAQRNLITIALTISESVRFRLISEHFTDIFRTGTPWNLEPWMYKMIRNWGFLSQMARDYAASQRMNEADLPIEPIPGDRILIQEHGFEAFRLPVAGPRLCAVYTMKLINLDARKPSGVSL